MQDSRINYVVVGAFVAAMLAAFVVVIGMLAGRTGATDPYFTVYSNVSGVKYGTIVFYEGYQIGQVVGIEPQQRGSQLTFKVDMEVTRGWSIPEDSVARAMVSGLLAAVAVDIRAGKSPVMLKPGSQIKGQESGNLFATLADIGAQFGELSTSSIRPLLDNINAYVTELSAATAGHLPEIMANLDKIAQSVQHASDAIDKGVLKPENIKHLDSMIASADQTATNLAALSKGLEQTRATLDRSIGNIDKLVDGNAGNVNEAMRSFRYTLDTLARHVDDIAHNADVTARNMAEFSRSIREDPGLLLGGTRQPDQAKAKDRRR